MDEIPNRWSALLRLLHRPSRRSLGAGAGSVLVVLAIVTVLVWSQSNGGSTLRATQASNSKTAGTNGGATHATTTPGNGSGAKSANAGSMPSGVTATTAVTLPGQVVGTPTPTPTTVAGTSVPAGQTPTATTTATLPDRVVGTPTTAVPPAPTSNVAAWTGKTTGGLSLDVQASATSVSPAILIAFEAAIHDPAGGLKALTWDFGDSNTLNSNTLACSDPANQPTVGNGQTDFSARTSHAYRTAGTYTVRVTATTGSRCGSNAPDDTVSSIGTITVQPGPASTNGPQNPQVSVVANPDGLAAPGDPQVEIRATSSDPDGFITQVVVDWDDGSAPSTVAYPTSGCTDPPNGWPSSGVTNTLNHLYAHPGTYDIAVTATSTGCQGLDSQQGLGLATVTTGGSQTPVSTPTSKP